MKAQSLCASPRCTLKLLVAQLYFIWIIWYCLTSSSSAGIKIFSLSAEGIIFSLPDKTSDEKHAHEAPRVFPNPTWKPPAPWLSASIFVLFCTAPSVSQLLQWFGYRVIAFKWYSSLLHIVLWTAASRFNVPNNGAGRGGSIPTLK